jgi:hypothetical protein
MIRAARLMKASRCGRWLWGCGRQQSSRKCAVGIPSFLTGQAPMEGRIRSERAPHGSDQTPRDLPMPRPPQSEMTPRKLDAPRESGDLAAVEAVLSS